MEHFYKSNTTVVTPKRAAKGLKVAMGSKIFSVLLLGFFLLVSGEGFGQTTYYSFNSGSWNDLNSWSTKATGQQQVPSTPPGANDFVEITSGKIITVPAGDFSCSQLKIHSGGGMPKEGGQIVLGAGGSSAARLTTTNLFFTRATGQPKERATLRMGSNGHIIVNGRVNIVDNKEVNVNNPANTDIFYSFDANSTFEYSGGAQELFNFSVVTVTDNQGYSETSTTYGNLILSGSGTKTANASIDVRSNMTISNVAFSPGSFAHAINGNLTLTNRTASIIGNSTLSGLGLTVGGNVTNSGDISFQSRVLTVVGNFTNNSGATFTAGSGVHTISGNWNNAGTFNAGATGTIALNGLNKTISSTGAGVFNNLNLSGGAKELLSDITVNKELRLSNIILDTKTNKVVLGSTSGTIIPGETATQHIKGTVETTRTIGLGATNVFGEIGFRIAGSAVNLGEVTVRRVTGSPFKSPNGNNSEPRQFYVSSGSAVEGLNTAIEMKFPAYDLFSSTASAYDIYRFTGATFNVVEKLEKSTSAIPDYDYKLDNAGKYGMYTLSSSIVPLPVELVSFKAQRHAQGVSLTWATASELDNSGFEVQVSTDARTFEKIGFVESKVGTTSLRQEYSFIDTRAVSDTRYYRLKQIDLDGTITYSSIRAVALGEGNGQVSTYPNPFDDMVVVKLNGTEVRNVKAVLLNAQGKAIMEQQQETAGNTITLDMSGVTTKGMYMLHVLDNGKRHTFKLMKR